MVKLRQQIRKNYDEKRMHNTIYAREMQMNKERIRKQRQAKERRERKKRKAEEEARRKEEEKEKEELKYCSSPEGKEKAMQLLNEVDILTKERESDCLPMYKNTYDTFGNRLNRLNEKLSNPISLDTSPDDIPPSDIRVITNTCKQLIVEEKQLRETVRFGPKFNGPQGCDLHRYCLVMLLCPTPPRIHFLHSFIHMTVFINRDKVPNRSVL